MMKPAAVLGFLGCCLVCAASAADNAAELERLLVQRQAIEAQYQSAFDECAHRFVVTRCQLDVLAAKRNSLQNIEATQRQLERDIRRAQAQEHTDRVAAKQQERQQELDSLAAEAVKRAASNPDRPTALPAQGQLIPTQAGVDRPVLSGDEIERRRNRTKLQRAESAKAALAARQERERQMQEHARQVRLRNAERENSGKLVAKPLPVPGAGSASSK